MKKLLYTLIYTLAFLGSSVISFSQTLNPFYQNTVNQVSFDSLLFSLKKIESLGIRTTPSVQLSNASSWLFNKYLEFGYTNVTHDSFLHTSDSLENIVVKKNGTTHPEKILLICGHYDSKNGPGVNDNGSGIAIILEIARLLKNIQTEYSILFINFTGEEEGYVGSHHYVDFIAVPQNQDIFLVLNIDEVGGVSGMQNNIIKCEKDYSFPMSNNAASSAYTDTLVSLVHMYSSLQTEISNAYGSDYVPFQQSNFTITGLFEKNQSSFVHSINDSLKNLDTSYVYEIAKAAVGASLYFSKAYTTSDINEQEKKNNDQFIFFPNPSNDRFLIKTSENKSEYQIQISDINLKQIYTGKLDDFEEKNNHYISQGYAIYFYKIIRISSGICVSRGILTKSK